MDTPPALRRILLRSIVALNLLAVLLLAVPLAVAVWSTYRTESVAALEREATRMLALTSETDLAQAPQPLDSRVTIGFFDGTGLLIAGSGPASDSDAFGALGDGVTRVKTEEGQLAVYVPFEREGHGAVTIRATIALSTIRTRTLHAWLLLGGLVLASVAASAAVALRRASSLARPFERLARAAHDFRLGAFALSIPATGVREGDEVARALEAAAHSAAERVDAAHALAEDASHQVRTPITAARLTLESALAIPGSDLGKAAATSVGQLDRASEALGEVLALRRLPSSEVPKAPALPILHESVTRWQGVLDATQRSCVLESAAVPPGLEVAGAVLRQVIDVLLDNSVRHGRGVVRVGARVAGAWLLVDVSDSGSVADVEHVLFTRGVGHGTGLGLTLAKSLAESVGGRLVLAEAAPSRFTLVLPTGEES